MADLSRWPLVGGRRCLSAVARRYGEAVSIGMAAAARLSMARRLLSAADVGRLEALLVRLGLPVRMTVDTVSVIDALRKDKKREGELVHFVLLQEIGRAVMVPIGIEEIEGVLNDLCESR